MPGHDQPVQKKLLVHYWSSSTSGTPKQANKAVSESSDSEQPGLSKPKPVAKRNFEPVASGKDLKKYRPQKARISRKRKSTKVLDVEGKWKRLTCTSLENTSEKCTVSVEVRNKDIEFSSPIGPLFAKIATKPYTMSCIPCCEEISRKKSVVRIHVGTDKHAESVARMQREREISIAADALRKNTEKNDIGCVPKAVQDVRLKALRILMLNGIPRNRLQNKWGGLGPAIGDGSNLTRNMVDTYIPTLQKLEMQQLQKEIASAYGKRYAIFFDGTTSVAECFAIIIRYLDDKLNIQQRVLAVTWLDHSMNAHEMASELYDGICNGIPGSTI